MFYWEQNFNHHLEQTQENEKVQNLYSDNSESTAFSLITQCYKQHHQHPPTISPNFVSPWCIASTIFRTTSLSTSCCSNPHLLLQVWEHHLFQRRQVRQVASLKHHFGKKGTWQTYEYKYVYICMMHTHIIYIYGLFIYIYSYIYKCILYIYIIFILYQFRNRNNNNNKMNYHLWLWLICCHTSCHLSPMNSEKKLVITPENVERWSLIGLTHPKKNNETAHVGWLFIQHQSNKSL